LNSSGVPAFLVSINNTLNMPFLKENKRISTLLTAGNYFRV